MEAIAESVTVESIFVRHRNCLMLRADFSPLYVGYYLHLMEFGLKHGEAQDALFKETLALFALHLVSRPWDEYHAWTLNLCQPMTANVFLSGSSMSGDVVGRIFTENVKATDKNMLFAQCLRGCNKEPQNTAIHLHGEAPMAWMEDFYRQSEQRLARAFYLGGDSYALITAEPGADEEWLRGLTPEDAAKITELEETKVLEKRSFKFNCGCTIEKILPTLKAMQGELEDLLQTQGYVEVCCPRCEAKYRLGLEDFGDTETES